MWNIIYDFAAVHGAAFVFMVVSYTVMFISVCKSKSHQQKGYVKEILLCIQGALFALFTLPNMLLNIYTTSQQLAQPVVVRPMRIDVVTVSNPSTFLVIIQAIQAANYYSTGIVMLCFSQNLRKHVWNVVTFNANNAVTINTKS
jgi:hypothetical protein